MTSVLSNSLTDEHFTQESHGCNGHGREHAPAPGVGLLQLWEHPGHVVLRFIIDKLVWGATQQPIKRIEKIEERHGYFTLLSILSTLLHRFTENTKLHPCCIAELTFESAEAMSVYLCDSA